MAVLKILTGGQSGVDQGALLAAEFLGLRTGGWMPKGFKTEDGPRPDLAIRFNMREFHRIEYPRRTRMNVRDSDGTLILGDPSSPDSLCASRACRDFNKPSIFNPSVPALIAWIEETRVSTLHVSGDRASRWPEGKKSAFTLLVAALSMSPETLEVGVKIYEHELV